MPQRAVRQASAERACVGLGNAASLAVRALWVRAGTIVQHSIRVIVARVQLHATGLLALHVGRELTHRAARLGRVWRDRVATGAGELARCAVGERATRVARPTLAVRRQVDAASSKLAAAVVLLNGGIVVGRTWIAAPSNLRSAI